MARSRDSETISLHLSVVFLTWFPPQVGQAPRDQVTFYHLPTSVARAFLVLNSSCENPGVGSDWPNVGHVPMLEPITMAGGSCALIGLAWILCLPQSLGDRIGLTLTPRAESQEVVPQRKAGGLEAGPPLVPSH